MPSSTAPAGSPDGIFVDTGAFYAAIDARDAHHEEAVEVLRRAGQGVTPMVTSKWTVVETHALLLARTSREIALGWLDRIPAAVVPVTSQDEQAALRIIRSHRDKSFTLVDAASFAIMERLGLKHYHSYDRHFRQYGRFTAVTPELW